MIDTLYGHCPDNLWFSVCYGNEREGKRMKEKAFQVGDREAAKAFVKTLGSDYNVFITCGLRREAGRTRGGPDSIVALPAAWLDIDIAYDGDKKPRFAYEADARQFVNNLWGGMMPSLIVHTGHGLQVWYIFDEPMEPDKLFMERFVRTAKQAAEERGVVIDSVYDLSRIMRLAGTWNVKGEIPLPAKIIETLDVRYSPSDFEDYLCDLTPSQGGEIRVNCKGDIAMPVKAVTLTRENKKFRAACERKDDGRMLDNSPSAHDMAMANIMAAHCFTAQDMVDTLRANRQSRNEDMKHPGYYEATAKKAIDWYLGKVQEEKVKVTKQLESGEAVDLFNELTELEVDHLLQYGTDNPDWLIVTKDGREILVGTTDDLFNINKARVAIANVTGAVLPAMKQAAWLNIISPLVKAAKHVAVADTTLDEQVKAWLESYAGDAGRYTNDKEKFNLAAAEGKPFYYNDYLYISLPHFEHWVGLKNPTVKDPAKKIALKLRQGGFEPQTFNINIYGATTTRRLWTKNTKQLQLLN